MAVTLNGAITGCAKIAGQVCAALAVPLALGAMAWADPAELTLLNWRDYLDPDVQAEFEKKYDARIQLVPFDSDRQRDQMVAQTQGGGFDLAIIDGLSVDLYQKLGWISEIPDALMPNRSHLDTRWSDAYEKSRSHAVPYFWGTTGIGYRADLTSISFDSWSDLFAPDPALCDHIQMMDDPVDVVTLALLYLGVAAETSDEAQVGSVRNLLAAQKPCVAHYGETVLKPEGAMVTGQIHAAMMYNGDASLLRKFAPNLRYSIPKEGSVIWVDYLVVFSRSLRKELALSFINYLNDPGVAARNAESVYYATPNKSARRLLAPQTLADSVIYPDQKSLGRLVLDRRVGARHRKRWARIFTEIKSASP